MGFASRVPRQIRKTRTIGDRKLTARMITRCANPCGFRVKVEEDGKKKDFFVNVLTFDEAFNYADNLFDASDLCDLCGLPMSDHDDGNCPRKVLDI